MLDQHNEIDAQDGPVPLFWGFHCRVTRDRGRFKAFLPDRGSQRLHHKRIPTESLTPARRCGGAQRGSSRLLCEMLRI